MIDILFCIAIVIFIISTIVGTIDTLMTNHKIVKWIKDSDVK